MRVFAQNEQRKRKAKQYLALYDRRGKERVGVVERGYWIGRTEETEDCGRGEAAPRVDEWNGGQSEHMARAPEEAEEPEEGSDARRHVGRDRSRQGGGRVAI